MHPSSKCISNTSFYPSNQPRTNSFGNYNQENHSKPYQFHHYIQDQPAIPELFLQHPQPQPQPQPQQFTNDHNYHTMVVVNSTLKTTSVHSTMEKSSYNESRVIPENISLKTRKRSSKKDRHSKINTAQGPRDRRMRLSLDVAKKFFKLQDMLGFDKASNTIQWLLMKSKPAIRNLQLNQSCSLIGLLNSASSPSDCEVLSGIDDQSIEKNGEEQAIIIDKADFNSRSCNNEKKKLDRVVSKSSYMHHSLAKETREKARARARKRTTEKRNIILGYDQYLKLRPQPDHIIDQNTNRLGSWIPYGESQVQTKTNQTLYPSSDFQFKQGIVGDNSSMISNNWSPSFLFSYQHNPGSYHEHHLTDFQILGKPWEGLNN